MFDAKAIAPLAAILVLAACTQSGGDPTEVPTPTLSDAAVKPPADPHFDGRAPELHVAGLYWGRLVDVYSLDPSGGARELLFADLVVGADLHDDARSYELVRLHGSQQEQLTILHPPGSPEFEAAVQGLQAGLTTIEDKSLAPTELPPWSMVPRNAALEIRFSDLLDPATIGSGSVALQVGLPAEELLAARVFADPNHGDLADPDGDGALEYYPTRIVVDLAPSALESLAGGVPLAPNPFGLPAAVTTDAPSAVLRLATRPDPASGHTLALANPRGARLAASGNGSLDASAPTLDLVRAFRAGGPSDVTGDPSNGFLGESEPPFLVGDQRVEVFGLAPSGGLSRAVVTIPELRFLQPACAGAPKLGDLLAVGDFRATVLDFSAMSGASVFKLRVRVVVPSAALPSPAQGLLTTAFDPATDDPACFLRFDPSAGAPPAAGVAPDATLGLRFSEPMDPTTLRPFDTLSITRAPSDPTAFEYVVGEIAPSPDATRFRFVPRLPFAHTAGAAETYYAHLAEGAGGPTDLAGNPLVAGFAAVAFQLEPTADTESNGGLAFRFDSADELYDDLLPELRGQFVFQLGAEVVLSRPVSRFPIAADRDKPVPSVMTPFPPGVNTPLAPLGAKLHSLWRYVDFGFSVLDETTMNVDVEGMAWAPVGGVVFAEAYDQFQISLGHSSRLPDEFLNPMTGFPAFPDSGLETTFASNFIFSEQASEGSVVHPKQRGYVVDPGDLFVAESGTAMMPWPLNQGIPLEDFEYYTWRDTSLFDVGGDAGPGVPQAQEIAVLQLPAVPGEIYPGGQVRTVGLPLLMEFRCYPDPDGLGVNAFDVSLAANSSARPNFRAYSRGGINTNGVPVIVDPDLEREAVGGFNPNSNPPGAPTQPTDNAFSIGQLDLITRVSRAHTIWLPTAFAAAQFAPAVAEPAGAGQPAGTEVRLAYRGATDIVLGGFTHITEDSRAIDFYGDPVPGVQDVPIFLGDDASWKQDLAELDGAAWIQVRITFLSNPVTSAVPGLSSLAFAWVEQ